MTGIELKEKILELVVEYVKSYPVNNGTPDMWRMPLVGFADVNDPYIRALPEVVAKGRFFSSNAKYPPALRTLSKSLLYASALSIIFIWF